MNLSIDVSMNESCQRSGQGFEEGSQHGSNENSCQGFEEGSQEGSCERSQEGSCERSCEGSCERSQQGFEKGSQEGSLSVPPILLNSTFICYSTPNYQPLVDNLFQSLRSIHFNMDNVRHKLDDSFHDLSVTGFRSPIWYHSITNKIRHLIDVLSTPHSTDFFFFSDCDITFFPHNILKWNDLELFIRNSDKSIFFMHENVHEDLMNGGFFIIKNNFLIHSFILFFTQVLNDMISHPQDSFFEDQDIINRIKHLIPYDFIHNRFVAWGFSVFDPYFTLFHHATCSHDVIDKLQQIHYIYSFITQN